MFAWLWLRVRHRVARLTRPNRSNTRSIAASSPLEETFRDRFLIEMGLAEITKGRVALILFRAHHQMPDELSFHRRLESALRQTVRNTDWVAVLPRLQCVAFVGPLPAEEGDALLGRVAEVTRREEVAWANIRGIRAMAPSAIATAVYPADGRKFEKLLDLARQRLESAASIESS